MIKYETIRTLTPFYFMEAHKQDCDKEERGNDCADFKADLRYLMEYSDGNPFYEFNQIRHHAHFNHYPEFRRHLIKYGFVREVEPEVFCRMGDRFRNEDGDEYILARAGFSALALILLKDGNRWTECQGVKDTYRVSKEEFGKICGGDDDQFTKIEKE